VRPAALAAAAALCGCAATPEPATPRALAPPAAPAPVARPAVQAPPSLRNASFEDDMDPQRRCAPGWDCTMHNDPASFRFYLQADAAAGARSLCVERVRNEPWALVTQAFDGSALRGVKLRLSMAVRVEDAGGGGAGPWVLVQGSPPISQQRLVRGTAGWQRLSVEVAVPSDRHVVEVGAALEGPGKACFDDVQLEVLPAR